MSVNKSIEQIFNVKAVAGGGLTLDQLKPYQVALFDEETNLTLANVPKGSNKAFRLVWKSPSTGTNTGPFVDKKNVKKPIKSLPIGEVDKITKFENAQTTRKVFESYLGYNGISPCKSLPALDCGSTYQLVLHASGGPVRDLLGRDYTEIIPFQTGCCENCTFTENIMTTLNSMVAAFNNSAFQIRNFFDVYPVYDCCPVPDPFDKVTFYDYKLTICDAGDDSALGDVQVAYQNNTIYRESRQGGNSVYRTDCVAAQPAAFVQTGTLLSVCATCPSGYTSGAAAKKYILRVDNASSGTSASAWLTEVQAVTGWNTATAAKRINYGDGTATYEVLVPSNFSAPTITTDAYYTYVCDLPVTCTLTSPVSTAWVQAGTRYKVKRTLELTTKNGDCSSHPTDLAIVTAALANDSSVVANTLTQTIAGDCVSTYTVQQYSNCLVDGCDWYGKDSGALKFSTLPAVLGQIWKPLSCEGWTFDNDGCPVAPAPVTAADCRGGLKFVGKNFSNPVVDCVDDIWEARETEGARLDVSLSVYGANTACDRVDVDYMVMQIPTTLQGSGIELLKREVQARSYSGYTYHSPSCPDGAITAARMGEKYSIEPNKFYHTVTLYHNYHLNRQHLDITANTREAITLAVEADKTALFAQVKQLVNEIAAVKGIVDFV